MPSIALVNTAECPCPWTHGAACREFLEGWDGYELSEAKTLSECANKDWLLLSNHKLDWDFLDALAIQNPDTIFLLWCYHDHLSRIPFKRWILTGEQYVDPPTLSGHVAAHAKALQILNYHPLWLRANEDPIHVGNYTRPMKSRHLAYFAGSGYKRDWIREIPDILYHDVHASGLLTSEERKELALNSMFALGFHSPENIANNHVTQRVFEGMAYGCIVLSDNPAAVKLTGGIVEYVGSRGELIEKMAYFAWNPEKMAAKRKAGYEWVRDWGTNRAAAKAFQEKAREVLGIRSL